METLQQKLQEIGRKNLAAVAVFEKNGKMLCGLRHYTPDKWQTVSVWTTPGGRCDPGETIEATLRREVGEEVGFESFKIIEFLGEFSGAKEGDIVYGFRCVTDEEPQLMEPEKFSEWHWFTPSEIPTNFINPPIINFLKEKLAK
ncbi:MAG: NUDIX hydrolase [Minisyncoccia bacterium]